MPEGASKLVICGTVLSGLGLLSSFAVYFLNRQDEVKRIAFNSPSLRGPRIEGDIAFEIPKESRIKYRLDLKTDEQIFYNWRTARIRLRSPAQRTLNFTLRGVREDDEVVLLGRTVILKGQSSIKSGAFLLNELSAVRVYAEGKLIKDVDRSEIE